MGRLNNAMISQGLYYKAEGATRLGTSLEKPLFSEAYKSVFLSDHIPYSRERSIIPKSFSKSQIPHHQSGVMFSRYFQSRLYGTDVRSPIPRESFYNRKREIEDFREVLEGKPQISVISGPVNSGKTTLILLLLEELSKNNRPVLHLDLRERSFSTVHELATSLEGAMASWLNSIFKVVQKTDEVSFGKLRVKRDLSKGTPIERLNDTFAMMSKELPEYNLLFGKQSPILFIDEANKLKMLLNREDKELKEEGHIALVNLFEWFVKNTKQEHRFHVVLGTSDSFYNLWIEEFVGPTRFKSYVVGNLSLEEAENFWKDRLLSRIVQNQKLPPPLFEDAYQACGGNIYLLEQYYSEYYLSKGDLTPISFSVVRAERALLVRALRKGDLEQYVTGEENLWTKSDFLTIIGQLVSANGNFLVYDELCDQFGEKTVKSLIQSNILHLRPTKKHAYDIPNHPDNAIVTAETPSSLLAMKKILTEIMSGELRPVGPKLHSAFLNNLYKTLGRETLFLENHGTSLRESDSQSSESQINTSSMGIDDKRFEKSINPSEQ